MSGVKRGQHQGIAYETSIDADKNVPHLGYNAAPCACSRFSMLRSHIGPHTHAGCGSNFDPVKNLLRKAIKVSGLSGYPSQRHLPCHSRNSNLFAAPWPWAHFIMSSACSAN